MSKQRNLSKIDKLIVQADHALRHLTGHSVHPARPSPAATEEETELEEKQRKHIAGLMRINHTGEICAQALYQGQALTAHSEEIKTAMEISADEEVDHLAWCEERVEQMGSRTSHLNPLFYGMSFGIGAVAGLIGDKISLGFVAATENQVCKHLRDHLQQIPEQDKKSRAILELMLEDEARHASKALEAGGIEFPKPVRKVMTLMSKVMTTTTYRI